MLLDYRWLLEREVLPKEYEPILLQMYKDCTTPTRQEYHSDWIVKYGVLSAKKVIGFMNSLGSSLTYIMPEVKTDAGESFVNLDDLIDSKDVKMQFVRICQDNRIFPYKIVGRTIFWLSEEQPDVDENGVPAQEDAEDCAMVLASRFKESINGVFENIVQFTIRPVFEEAYMQFSKVNNIPRNTSSIFRAKSSFLVQFYIAKGIAMGASDIYFDPKLDGYRVSYMIYNDYLMDDLLLMDAKGKDGVLAEILQLCGDSASGRSPSVVEDRSIIDLGKVNNKYNGRVNLFKNMKHDAICIRVVDKSKKAIPFEKLNISAKSKDAIDKLTDNNDGIVIIAGATGSGKSTSMMSMLWWMRRKYPYRRIETVENPIEQIVEEISQLSLEGSNATYDDVAKSLTRRNPSIIYMGELNTTNTVKFGINAALQKLYMMSTLHSTDARSIPSRIKNMTSEDPSIYPQFLQLSRGYIHQTMLKQTCENCTKFVDMSDVRITNDMTRVLLHYGYRKHDKIPLVEPNPDCPLCEGRGFLIRNPIIIVEVVIIDNKLRGEIMRAKDDWEVGEILHKNMVDSGLTGVQDALDYMRDGKLDWIQIWRKFSLFNEATSCVLEGDEEYREESVIGIRR